MFRYVQTLDVTYPASPFNPDTRYPELGQLVEEVDLTNSVYGRVRTLIDELGWDERNRGTAAWNPFSEIVRPGDTVIIKPNLVIHAIGSATSDSIVTHASVVRPLIDYSLLALLNEQFSINGRVVVADAPLQSADFGSICTDAGYTALLEHYKRIGLSVELIDLRSEWAVIDESFFILRRQELPGDPLGSRVVDLGHVSEHYDRDAAASNYSIQDYDERETVRHHAGNVHRYRVSGTVLSANVIINVPKLKTHNKAGVTLGLKNLIGINVSKDYLPHYVRGGPEEGGDEYPRSRLYSRGASYVRSFLQGRNRKAWQVMWRALRKLARSYEKTARDGEIAHGGAWYGNDTLWRTIIDVNRIALFADKDGCLRAEPQRRIVCFGDGIVGCEAEGPFKGKRRETGLVCAGDDVAEFDALTAKIMGFDYQRIPHILRAFDLYGGHEPTSVDLVKLPSVRFEAAPGWAGRIEDTLPR